RRRISEIDTGARASYSPGTVRTAARLEADMPTTKRSRPLALLSLLLVTLIAAPPGVAGAADVIKFGISTPLSGPAAPWGIPHKNATELIFEEINAQGGLDVGGKKYKLEVIAYDHKYVIAEGVAV